MRKADSVDIFERTSKNSVMESWSPSAMTSPHNKFKMLEDFHEV